MIAGVLGKLCDYAAGMEPVHGQPSGSGLPYDLGRFSSSFAPGFALCLEVKRVLWGWVYPLPWLWHSAAYGIRHFMVLAFVKLPQITCFTSRHEAKLGAMIVV
ncbi:unnamed protein product [Cuscuta campestris]|uniref:Uncharacterized protein n=1 Tax=Cuscuta campestris TaxID=132261 RepID=A0A484LNH4_9ASTE|nr:unnamed protein product [Cuscuta campestris]